MVGAHVRDAGSKALEGGGGSGCERARLEKIAKKRENEEFSPKRGAKDVSISADNPLTQLMRSRRSSRVAPV